MNAKSSESKPIAALWRPQVSGFMELEFGLTGVERKKNGQWVAQRWFVQPMSFADIEKRSRSTPVEYGR